MKVTFAGEINYSQAKRQGLLRYTGKICTTDGTRIKLTGCRECEVCFNKRKIGRLAIEAKEREDKVTAWKKRDEERKAIRAAEREERRKLREENVLPIQIPIKIVVEKHNAMDAQICPATDALLRPKVNYGDDNSFPDAYPYNITHPSPKRSPYVQSQSMCQTAVDQG